ncbi:hypothetical protein [uncultured Bradyrhizobium sp.]|jgi:hypothetical protein|uniref:hypothetical protein n=1 Tax=uncultured Bradyrhizobium sp. TaxID=199684 RepID=UPI002629661C|nr:hypothetical protein [uncultured Bradyrhizobium sp.]
MLGLIDCLSLWRKIDELDDQSVSSRRKVGNAQSRIIVFLPWNVSIETAEALRLLPNSYFACNETPDGIVSSTPEVPVQCLAEAEKVFVQDLATIRKSGRDPLLIGLSMGNFAATYLANKYHLDLISVASGHSGDWLTFNSPASRHLRLKAEAAGLQEADFVARLHSISPVNNLCSLGAASQFIFGNFDHYIPQYSRDALIAELRQNRPDIPIVKVPFGHVVTILLWKFLAHDYRDG